MLRDMEFFASRLGKINGFGDTGDFLANIVKSKEVKPKTPEPVEETEGSQIKDKSADDKKTDTEPATETKEEVVDTKEESKDGSPSEGSEKQPED